MSVTNTNTVTTSIHVIIVVIIIIAIAIAVVITLLATKIRPWWRCSAGPRSSRRSPLCPGPA